MKIGILGSGVVAQSLAGGFLKHGHAVTLGTREPAKLAAWAEKNPAARVASFRDAARFGEIVVLAVKGSVAGEALRAAGAENLARQDRHRRDQSDRGRSARQWRAAFLHEPRRLADGAAAA